MPKSVDIMSKKIKHKNLRNVKSSLNYDYTKEQYEVNTLPSMTIPDQTMSIRTIVDRYTRGLPVTGFTPVYEGEEYFPDPKTLDLTERHELAEQYKAEVASIKSRQWKQPQDVENAVENLKNDVENVPNL